MKGVVSENSIDYVNAIFSSWEEGCGVVLLRSEDDAERIELTDAAQAVVKPGRKFGWFTPRYSSQLGEQDTALISFTSGTEGKPKGVLLSRQALDDVVSRLNSAMAVNDDISEYVGVPVNFSFGFGRCRAIAAAGGRCFIPENGFNPNEIKDLLARDEINAVSAVPSLWRVLLKHDHIFGKERLSLKWIEIGSQYMSAEEKIALRDLFSNAAIVQHYGLTEASRSTILRIDQTPDEYLESVGKVNGSSQVSISDAGRICIKGPHVASQIIVNDALTENVNQDGLLETTDLGELKQGYLFYKGRADDVINCGGIKISPEVIEADICQSLNIGPIVAVSKVKNELTGEGILVSVLASENLEKASIIEQTHEALCKFGVNNKSVIQVQFVDDFPKTSTGKVQRNKLEEHFNSHHQDVERLDESTSSPEPQATSSAELQGLTSNEDKVAAIWREVLQGHEIDLDTDFYSLGGDSLTAIGAIISMERQGVPSNIAKGMMQGFTIRQIAQGMDDEAKPAETTANEDKVAAIWREVLQGHEIDLDTDFYSLGGDSLTAIGAIISMERQGVPSNIAKGMMQGFTIRQIARHMDDESNQAGDEIKPVDDKPVDDESEPVKATAFSTPIARGALAINTIRGILVCCVVLSHWWEGLFARLPASFSDIIPYLGPFLSAGTPGFAVAFGVTVGYALMPTFHKNPERLKNVFRKMKILLAVGVVILAIFRFGAKLVEGRVENFTHFTNSFYSVLTYYFLASITIYYWIKLINKTEHWVLNALFYSVLTYSLFLFVFEPLDSLHAEGLIELAKISLGAKYSYFSLMTGSLLGIVIGGKLRQFVSEKDFQHLALIMGAILILAAITLGLQYQEDWTRSSLGGPVYMHRWLMYAGVITILFSGFNYLLPFYERSFVARLAFRWFAATGILAFPIFVLHELVIPLKIMIDGLSSLSIGLPIAMALFLSAAFYLYRKVYRATFS